MTPKQRFVILCQHFLDSYNPEPENTPAMLDCILAVPENYIPNNTPSLRSMAHDFCRYAYTSIHNPELQQPSNTPILKWADEWTKVNVPAPDWE